MKNPIVLILQLIFITGCKKSSKIPELFPNCKKKILGRSLKKNPIYLFESSATNVPAVLLVGSIHGDETPGVYAGKYFFDKFTSDKYSNLNKDIKIYYIPTLNPDNFAKRRHTANNIDLNRNFYSVDKSNKAIETKLMMDFIDSHPDICLTINFHSGALVICYPLDQPRNYSSQLDNSRSSKRGLSGIKAETEEALIFKKLCLAYSNNHAKNNSYEKAMNQSSTFPGGICNGSHWYPISGSFPDYCYLKYGIPSLTAEISQIKNPNFASKMGPENFEAILETIKTMLDNSISGTAPLNSVIEINNKDNLTFRTFNGSFFRICYEELEIRAKLNNKYSNWVKCKRGEKNIILTL